MMFVLTLMLAGLAVDLMRYEASRVALQNTLDRATLAAAALNQDLDPEAVVRDYVAKAGKASPMPRLFWSWTCPARCRARKSPG